jgi:hypothetical protein
MQTAGRHNTDPTTVLHLENVKAWKRQRIVYIIPAGKSIATKVYLSHINLTFPPNNGVARIATIDTEVGDAYSKTIEAVITHPEFSKWEFILTIEHDNMPPPDGVMKLVAQMEAHPEFSCIGGLYYTKGFGGGIGGQPQIWGDPKDPVLNFRPQMPDPNGGLVECCGTGMGFNLWRLKMFKDKKLRRPWFHTQTENGVATQDLYFWTDARKYGYRCAIDCSVKVGHYSLEEDFVY